MPTNAFSDTNVNDQLTVGSDDSSAGTVIIYGGATDGGNLRIHCAADNDDTAQYWDMIDSPTLSGMLVRYNDGTPHTVINLYTTEIGLSVPLTMGTGYSGSGASIGTTGAIQTKGALTVDGISTLTGEVQVGGGYTATGVTVETDGDLKAAGALTLDGAATLGATSSNATIINGQSVSIPNLTTTDPAVAGRLWNDGGALKVSAG